MIISSILVMLPFFLYLRAPIVNLIQAKTSSIQIGTQPGLSAGAAATLATLILGVFLLLVCPILWHRSDPELSS